MFFKKIVTFFIIVNVLFSSLWAGELKIKNDNAIPIEVIVKAKDNNGADNPFTVIQVIEPSEEITVIIDEKKFSATTFFIEGVTITNIPSNECILHGCGGRVLFTSGSDGMTLFCRVTETLHWHLLQTK